MGLRVASLGKFHCSLGNLEGGPGTSGAKAPSDCATSGTAEAVPIKNTADRRFAAPIRRKRLPNLGENLSANAFAASLTASHDALGGRHDRDAEAALDTANFIASKVHAAAGT